LVICIGLSSKSKSIQWVKPFSWSPTGRIIPDVREGIMRNPEFNVDKIANSVWYNVDKEYQRRDFEEFSYITVEPPTWAMWVTFFITLIITAGVCYWAIVNDIDGSNDPLFRSRNSGYRY